MIHFPHKENPKTYDEVMLNRCAFKFFEDVTFFELQILQISANFAH